MNNNLHDQLLELKKCFRNNAALIDKHSVFSTDNLAELKKSGLMAALIPVEYGGLGMNIEQIVEITGFFAEACLSTAIIWGMHCQQIATLVEHADEEFKIEYFEKIAHNQMYIGSITTEETDGGHLFSLKSQLIQENINTLTLERKGPVCTGGKYCDAFLISMKLKKEIDREEIVFVFVENTGSEVEEISQPVMMGMRGTHTVSLKISCKISTKQIICNNVSFKNVALKTLIPFGHLIWSSAWLGAGRGILEDSIKFIFRNPENRKNVNIKSEILLETLARIRLSIDIVESCLNTSLKTYTESIEQGNSDILFKPGFQIKINNLKVIASEQIFDAINKLIDITGLKFGYIENQHLPIERVFRDIRSASLMYNNSKLLIANGSLVMVENSKISFSN